MNRRELASLLEGHWVAVARPKLVCEQAINRRLVGRWMMLSVLVRPGCSHNDEWSIAPEFTDSVNTPADSGSMRLVFSHTIGAGILDDTRGAVAVSSTGSIAVEETADCRVSVFDIRDGALLYRAGRCGSGPGEMRNVVSLFFRGDTLIVVDAGLRAVSRYNGNGTYLGRESVRDLWGNERLQLGSVSPLGADQVVAQLAGVERGGVLVAVIDRVSHRTLRRFIKRTSAEQHHRNVEDYGVKTCTAHWPNGPALVAVGMYEFEAVAFDSALLANWRIHTPLEWFKRVTHENVIHPSAYMIRPLCGPQGVLVRATVTPPFAPKNSLLENGYVELYGPAGKLLMRAQPFRYDETLLRPGGNWGDLWAFDDATSTVPRLRVYRLTARTDMSVLPADGNIDSLGIR